MVRLSGALHFVGLELFAAGAFAQVGDGALQADKAALLGALHHWYDQSPVERDGDAQVDGSVIVNVVAFDRRLMMGHLRMPCTAARAKKGVKVSLLPVACSNLVFILSRSYTMRVMSTSKTRWTCALARFDITMCSAIFLRMTDMGTISPGITPATG